MWCPEEQSEWHGRPYRINELPDEPKIIERLRPALTDSALYLILDGGGLTYQLHKGGIERRDQSFDQRVQHGGYFFGRGNRLYAYGGYGFFEFRSYLAEWSPHSGGWEIWKTANPPPPGRYEPLGFHNQRALYVVNGGNATGLHTLQEEKVLLQDVWQLQWETRRWKKLGRMNATIPQEQPSHRHVHWNDRLYLLTEKRLFCLDFENNRFAELSQPTDLIRSIYRIIPPALDTASNQLLVATLL